MTRPEEAVHGFYILGQGEAPVELNYKFVNEWVTRGSRGVNVMISHWKRSDRGNSSTIGALIIVGLIGFAVFVVNGGMVFLQRQGAQQAVDAASLAGALALTQGYELEQIKYIVLERAKDQGFDSADPDTTVQLAWLPAAVGANSTFTNYLHVIITTDYTSLFSSIFNSGKGGIVVDAIAHARMNEDLAPGYAVVALNEEACEASIGRDNLEDSQTDNCWAYPVEDSMVNPVPVTGGAQVKLTEIPLPDCSGLPDFGVAVLRDSVTLQPGAYESISIQAEAIVNLNPGLYCIYGATADGNSFQMGEHSMVVGQQVMLYLMKGAGAFQVDPASASYFYAPDSLVDFSGNQWSGMLLYADPGNEVLMTLTGTSKTTYQGTIYAPGARCEARGTAGFVTLKSQLICDTIRFEHVGGLYVSYDMATNYHLPESVEIMD